MFRRSAIFAYSIASYAVFFVTYLYAAGFLGNFLVPKSIDSPRAGSVAQAILVDAGLRGGDARGRFLVRGLRSQAARTAHAPPRSNC